MRQWNMNWMTCILLLCLVTYANEHGHGHSHGEGSNDSKIFKTLVYYLEGYTKAQQANIGAFIISSAPLPIFALILIFRIENMKILDIMSAFAAGALIGDVFIHNIPEIFHDKHDDNHTQDHHHHHSINSYSTLIEIASQKEVFICWGVLFLFIMEKLLGYFSRSKVGDEEDLNNDNGHCHSSQSKTNIIISLFGDFLHNFTDGLGIGAGFNKCLKIGISLSLSIFFHEIPHEIGDFSYLLKQRMSTTNVLLSQLLSALGAFIGVYVSNLFNEQYSNHMIAFASGAFLYLGINTIMGDLKKTHSLINICLQCIAFAIGVLILVLIL